MIRFIKVLFLYSYPYGYYQKTKLFRMDVATDRWRILPLLLEACFFPVLAASLMWITVEYLASQPIPAIIAIALTIVALFFSGLLLYLWLKAIKAIIQLWMVSSSLSKGFPKIISLERKTF